MRSIIFFICLLKPVGGQLFKDGVLDAVNGFKDSVQDDIDLINRLFTPTQLEVELKNFENPNFGGSKGIFPLIAKAFQELLLSLGPGGVVDCETAQPQTMPEMAAEFFPDLPSFFEYISQSSCDVGDLSAPGLFLKERYAQPIVDFFSGSFTASAGRRLENRELQTSQANLQCVTRLDEGSMDGMITRMPDIDEFRGGTNQYAWGNGFNPDLGYGVTVHSLGAPGALISRYSTPTFTIRDREANVVFQGILAEPSAVEDESFNVGIRAAQVVGVEQTDTDTIFTVIGASVLVPNGFLLEYKFSQQAFMSNGMQPVTGLGALRAFPLESSSARSLQIIAPGLILYAPTFDIDGFQDSTFFRLFDLNAWSNVGPRIYPADSSITTGDPRLPGIIWDFDCSLDTNGLCFLNTIGFDLGDLDEFFDEITIPTTSYFPTASIPLELAQQPLSNNTAILNVTVISNSFDVKYSAQSLESVSAASSMVCTLSGFLFRGGSVTSNPSAAVPDPAVASSLGDFRSILNLLELGQPQQCEICTGEIAEETRRRRATRRGRRRLMHNGDEGKSGSGKVGNGKSGPGPEGRVKESSLPANTCQRIDILNQPSTSAYIWAIEECGGKMFIGTYDIASVLGEILMDIFVAVVAAIGCRNPLTVALACASNPGQCGIDQDENIDICDSSLRRTIDDALPSGLRTFFSTTLATEVFEEIVTPFGIGFDLYSADVEDVLAGTAVFTPVTQNGFRELSPAKFESDPAFVAAFGFEPSSQNNEAIRTMSCAKSENGDSLLIGSAVFRTGATSNTYVVDMDCLDA